MQHSKFCSFGRISHELVAAIHQKGALQIPVHFLVMVRKRLSSVWEVLEPSAWRFLTIINREKKTKMRLRDKNMSCMETSKLKLMVHVKLDSLGSLA